MSGTTAGVVISVSRHHRTPESATALPGTTSPQTDVAAVTVSLPDHLLVPAGFFHPPHGRGPV